MALDLEVLEKLWEPKYVQSTFMEQFKNILNHKYSLNLNHYEDIYEWSIQNIEQFWEEIWNFVGIRSSVLPTKVLMKCWAFLL